MDSSKKGYLSGVFYTLLGAIFWGFSGASSEYLLETYNISPPWLSMVRMLSAGIILFILLAIKEREALKAIWKDGRSWKSLLIFGIFGLMANQLSYLTAISYTDAGTATVIQYIAPVLILVYISLRDRKLPTGKELVGVCLTLMGIFLISTPGDIKSLFISKLGLF